MTLLRIVGRASIALLSCLAVTACSRVGGDATQVAAKVNDVEISLAQLQHVVQRQGDAGPRSEEVARRALEAVVDQELAAQGARKLGLDKDPRIVQAIEAAKRETLARAYQDAVAEKAPLPSSDEIDRYYDSQPALFAQRKFYELQEISVRGPHDALAALQPRVEATTDAAVVGDMLREAKLPFNGRRLTISPEDVPLALIGKLADLRPGRSIMLPHPAGARVITLLNTTPAPLSREAARPAIQAYLTNERKRRAIADNIKSMRAASQVEYKGKFAQAASAPAAAESAVARQP